MKGFFQSEVPKPRDILLFESGSQNISARALASLRHTFTDARLHLVTCWPEAPPGPFARVFRVRDYPSRLDKLHLLGLFRKEPPDVLVIVCSGEPIMYAWKMLALLRVPAKTVIVNENGDYFWLDFNNRRALRQFLQSRWAITRTAYLLTVLRAIAFPFIVLYLIANAGYVYTRRWRRLLLWKIQGRTF